MQHQKSKGARWYSKHNLHRRFIATIVRLSWVLVQSEEGLVERDYRRVMTGPVGSGDEESVQRGMERLFGLVLEEGDEVVAVLGLLETTKGHLGTGNVLLGVLEVLEERVLVPGDALLLVGVGVRVALDLTGLTTEEPVEHGADLVALTLLQGVALRAAGLEEVGTLLSIACGDLLAKWSS